MLMMGFFLCRSTAREERARSARLQTTSSTLETLYVHVFHPPLFDIHIHRMSFSRLHILLIILLTFYFSVFAGRPHARRHRRRL
jgi:hypothetical protein